MAEFITSTILPLNNVSCASSTSTTSSWYDVRVADGFNLWYYMTSAGTPTMTITAHVSLFDCKDHNTAPTTPVTGGTNYRSITWTNAATTLDAWTHVDTPAELANYPIKWMRINAAIADADATGIYIAIGKNGV